MQFCLVYSVHKLDDDMTEFFSPIVSMSLKVNILLKRKSLMKRMGREEDTAVYSNFSRFYQCMVVLKMSFLKTNFRPAEKYFQK